MAAGEPRVLVDNAAEPVAELVIGPFPQRPKSAGRGHDRVVVDAVARTDLGDLIRHAGAAGDAVDQALARLQAHRAGPARRRPSPTARSCGCGLRRWSARRRHAPAGSHRRWHRQRALRAVRAACARDRAAGSACPSSPKLSALTPENVPTCTGRSPCSRAFAIRYGDALAALDERQHLATRHENWV